MSCHDGDVKLLGAYDIFDDADYGHLDLITKGRIKVCSGGLFHILCGESWDSVDATVVCRQLRLSQYGNVATYTSTCITSVCSIQVLLVKLWKILTSLILKYYL